jgi:ABC-type antimicrobial peptide transport system permease subunit
VIGARASDVLRLVCLEGFQVVGLGIAVGLLASTLMSRLLGTFLFGVGPTDPWTMVAASLAFTAVAFVAFWLPARRSLEILPSDALRGER